MPIPIFMPSLSPTMTEGNLVKWSKDLGDQIKPGDIIAEVETDKATMEIESIDEGKLEKIMHNDGTEGISVNSLIAVLSLPKDSAEDIEALIEKYSSKEKDHADVSSQIDQLNKSGDEEFNKKENINAKVEKDSLPQKLSYDDNKVKENVLESSNDVSLEDSNRIFISPLARRLAQINNIDLKSIKGTGPKGKILKVDIDNLTHKYSSLNNKINVNYNDRIEDKKVKISSMRKAISKKMSYSKSNIPHFYLNINCEMDKLLNFRSDINSGVDNSQKISINDFVIKSLAKSLIEVPEANCSWQEEYILNYGNADISVAIAVKNGLFTPVIKNADRLGFKEISSSMKNFINKAKDNKLTPEEYEGGSYTVSNLGMYNIESFSAIINPPHAGILSVGSIRKELNMSADGKAFYTSVMSCQLAGDHRVIDGVTGAKLLQSFKMFIENPSKMLL